jgi:hypothetical protein
MNYKACAIILMWTAFFLFSCSSNKSKENKENVNHQTAVIHNAKNEDHQLISKGKTDTLINKPDTSNSKIKSFADDPLPIIMFAVPNTDQAFKQVKKWGATYVQKYGMGKSIEKDQSFFDRANKYGLEVMGDISAKYWLKGNKDMDTLHKYIAHFKRSPALGFWYLSDEPAIHGVKASELEQFYKFIKKETPKMPTANSHAWAKNWTKYGKVQNILMFDYYPVYAAAFPKGKLKSWTNFEEAAFKNAKKDHNLVMPIIQIFNWKTFAKKNQKKYHNYSVKDLRYPNSAELRYMIFSSIALGARGIALFSYARGPMVDPKWGSQVLAPVLKEAKNFAGQVGNLHKQKIYSVKDQNILFAFWSNNKSKFIILANTTPDERNKVRLNINTKIGNLKGFKPWGQSSKSINVSLSGKQLIINKIKPWGIIILKQENT